MLAEHLLNTCHIKSAAERPKRDVICPLASKVTLALNWPSRLGPGLSNWSSLAKLSAKSAEPSRAAAMASLPRSLLSSYAFFPPSCSAQGRNCRRGGVTPSRSGKERNTNAKPVLLVKIAFISGKKDRISPSPSPSFSLSLHCRGGQTLPSDPGSVMRPLFGVQSEASGYT
jgi:hypothetical protein